MVVHAAPSLLPAVRQAYCKDHKAMTDALRHAMREGGRAASVTDSGPAAPDRLFALRLLAVFFLRLQHRLRFIAFDQVNLLPLRH
jgi:hypothetical protein